MKISQKLILLFLLMALIPILVIGAFSYINTQRALNQQITIQISNTLSRQVNKINNLIQQDTTKIALFAAYGSVRVHLGNYDRTGSADAKQQLIALVKSLRQDDRSMRRMHVLDPRGIVIASSDSRFLNRDYSGSRVFKTGLTATDISMFFKDIDGVLGQYLTAPIVVDDKTVGVAVLEHQVDSYALATHDYVDVGKTGETFMVGPNDRGETVNLLPLRFDDKAALAPYKTKSSRAQVQDYRGQPVLQKTAQLPDTKWTVGVKIDKAEIYAPVLQLRNITLIIIAVTTIVVGLIGLYFARYITAPIKRFTEVVMRIRSGGLTERVRVESNDEIGLLGKAFNEMTNNLMESRARLVASILSVPFGFGLIDVDGHIAFANPLFSQLLGHRIPDDPEESRVVLDKINADFKHTLDLKQLVAKSQTTRRSIERNIEYGPMFFRLFFVPIIATDNRVLGTVLLVENTTERMAMERSRDEFFSIASHELRTPLTAVRGNSDMILDYYQEEMKNLELKNMVTDIHDASLRLIDIVNDFLDMSRLEQGRMVLKNTSFDIAELIRQTMMEFDVTGSRRKLALTLTPPTGPLPQVFGDRDRTRQILTNLLGNAIRYTQEGGVAFTASPVDGGMVEVTVTDTGQGIPLESQHLLFRKFQQASSNILTRDTTRSTGLGLYISKLLCEDMGGKIRLVKSEPGKGTTFAFTLPITTPERVAAAAKLAKKAGAPGVSDTTGIVPAAGSDTPPPGHVPPS